MIESSRHLRQPLQRNQQQRLPKFSILQKFKLLCIKYLILKVVRLHLIEPREVVTYREPSCVLFFHQNLDSEKSLPPSDFMSKASIFYLFLTCMTNWNSRRIHHPWWVVRDSLSNLQTIPFNPMVCPFLTHLQH